MRKIVCFLMMVLLLNTVSGCSFSSKDVPEPDKKASGEAGSGDADTKANPLYQELGIPEKVEEVFQSEQGETIYTVDSEVTVPEEAVPGILKQKKASLDIDDINHMADTLFDGGTYEQVKPLICYSFEELAAMKDTLLKKLADKEEATYYADKIRYTEILTLLKREKEVVSTYQEGGFTKAPDDDYASCRCDEIYIVEGEIAGAVYQLIAYKEEGQVNIRIAQMTEGYSELFPGGDIEMNLAALTSDEDETASGEDSPVVGEHRFNSVADSKSSRPSYEKALEEGSLSYSEEEAAELACSFVEQLVSEEMTTSYTMFRTGTHADCYALRDLDETPFQYTQGNPPIDGYKLVLQRRIKGLSLANIELLQNPAENGETEPTEQEYYEVEVSNRGVVNVRMGEPMYQVTENMKEAPELMKFSDIMEIMKEALEEETKLAADEDTGMSYLLNRITLSYVTVQYDGEYVLLPAWTFQETEDGAVDGIPHLIISAVDGSILYRPEHWSEE